MRTCSLLCRFGAISCLSLATNCFPAAELPADLYGVSFTTKELIRIDTTTGEGSTITNIPANILPMDLAGRYW